MTNDWTFEGHFLVVFVVCAICLFYTVNSKHRFNFGFGEIEIGLDRDFVDSVETSFK